MKRENKNKIIVIAMFILFVFSFSLTARGEIKEVEIGIDGLSCPFCVFGLKQQMKGVKTVKDLNINFKEAIATVALREKSLLNIKDYNDAVKKSGFSVREIKISAEGEIINYGDFLALKVSGTNQLFILFDAEDLKVDTKVLIKGKVHEHAEGEPYGLWVEKADLIRE